jgi:16S rRNA processing protein RimM
MNSLLLFYYQKFYIEEEAKIDYSAPIRGTTVPTLGAASLKRKEPIKFENVSSIIPSDAYTFGYVKIGTISSPHGVKGEVKLIMETDFAEERLKAGSVLYVKRPYRRSPRPIRVTNSRQQVGNVYLVSFDSVKTRLGATALKDFLVYIRQEDRPELGIDEYLIRDLVGLDCYLANADNKNEIFGPVATVDGVVPPDELCDGPSLVKLMHSMLELRKINNEDELCLIPLVPQIVLTIDLENKLLVIDNSYLYLFDYSYIEKKKIVIRGFLPAKSAYLTDKDRKELSKNSISINKLI